MKKINLLVSTVAIGLITLNSCKKDDMMAPSSNDGGMASGSKGASGTAGAVYVMDNSTAGNHIMVFSRTAAGLITASGSYSTGGNGTGSGLGSQGSITHDDNNVYAVNAGSNEISVLHIDGQSLNWVDKVASGGMTPISITVHDNILYVLNAGGTGNISGFTIDGDGHLTHLFGSDRPLSTSSSGGAEILFDESGTHLVVTEKATNTITVYPVDGSGVAGAGTSYPSVGSTPFGFVFGKNNTLIVSDAFGGMPLQSALSSYAVNSSGNVNLVTGPVATHQTAACWVAITNNGHFVYTTNAGSASISGYSVSNSGELTLLNSSGVTATTGANPIDLGFSRNSQYLYSLNNGGHSISMFSVSADGSLTSLGTLNGIPAGSVGLTAN